ncbi:hypothetical protein [Faecalibaculum rodentium]|uniref:hypothetical protein n=1 Tax=Faecalibaculum rodentium TaxID=1702221 RepID=UPI003513A609
MKTEQTPEGRAMDSRELMRMNRNAIAVLNLPRMLALILKKCCPERFAGSLATIEDRMRGELRSDETGMDEQNRNHLPSDLANSENENARTGLMRFDSIVLIVTEVAPNAFLVNVEVQNELRSYLWFAGRVYACIGRLLDSQKGDRSGYSGDQYQCLKPVLVLWILPHEDETYVVNFSGETSLEVGSDTRSGKAAKKALDGYIQYHVIGLGPDWMEHEAEAVQCLGHIFRCDDNQEKQFAYLEKEGIPMTAKAEKVLNEYSEDQFKWFHRSEKEKYDRMKAEMHAKLSDRDAKLKDRDAKLRDMEYEMERIRKENEMLKALAEKAGQNSNLSVAENKDEFPEEYGKKQKQLTGKP